MSKLLLSMVVIPLSLPQKKSNLKKSIWNLRKHKCKHFHWRIHKCKHFIFATRCLNFTFFFLGLKLYYLYLAWWHLGNWSDYNFYTRIFLIKKEKHQQNLCCTLSSFVKFYEISSMLMFNFILVTKWSNTETNKYSNYQTPKMIQT